MDMWRKDPWLRRAVMIAIVFWAIACGLVLQRYFTFYPNDVTFDQGIFNQVFWNSLRGNWFQGSLSSSESSVVIHDGIPPDVQYQRLGQHFTPALLLWLPVYALWPAASGLSVLQVTLVALGGLVLYALARCYHPPHIAGWITTGFYVANAVIAPTLANFHDLCQIPLYLFGLLLALEKRQWWVFWLLAVLTLAVREDTGIVLFGVGLYLLTSRRYPRIGVAVCALSVAYVVTVTNVIMPLFSEDISKRFMIEGFGQFADGTEASTLDIAWAMVRNPLRLMGELLSPVDRTARYLLGQWLPLAFVPAIAPSAWVMAGVPLLPILLQRDPNALSFNLRYAITVVPGLFYGAILWWATHPAHFRPPFRRFWGLCLVLALLLSLSSNPNRAVSFLIPDSIQPWVYIPPTQQWQHATNVRSLLAQIPPDASVSASGNLVPHLSGRREVLRFPNLLLKGDDSQVRQMQYIVLDLWYPLQQRVAFDGDRQFLEFAVTVLPNYLQRNRYGMVDFRDGVVLLRERVSSNPEAIAAWEAFQQTLQPLKENTSG